MSSSPQLYAVLIMLDRDVMLLPNAAVADVLSQEALKPLPVPVAQAPWLLGRCQHAGRWVPVVSFEVLNGGALPAPNRRGRVLVVNTPASAGGTAEIALLTQGYPHLVTLNRKALQPLDLREGDLAELVLARVNLANQQAAIPDLAALQRAYEQLAALQPDEARALV